MSPVSLATWLVARGLNPQQARLWLKFIVSAYQLMLDAHSLLLTPEEWNSFLTGCPTRHPTEPDLTSGIGDRMERLWVDAPLGSERNKLRTSYEKPTPGDQHHGKHKTKADFCFQLKYGAGACLTIAVEAKPLRRPADISRKYLADSGLGCFVSRNPPYTRDPVGWMVGYILQSQLEVTWQETLTSSLADWPGVGTKRFGLIDRLDGKCAEVLASDHDRTAIAIADDITILHLLLDFRPHLSEA
ncbi:MAG: hypothetical protein GC191_09400 [Azospirillum sp.]|nr:hypothetical protein [Azospirillum sp.]